MNVAVLGAGPVGLFSAVASGAELLLSQTVGGNKTLRELAPTYLWRTEASMRFLRELGFSEREREVRFAWLTPGGIGRVPEVEDLRAYHARSRGVSNASDLPTSLASSGAPGVLRVLDVDFEELILAAARRVNVLLCEIISVDCASSASGMVTVTVHNGGGARTDYRTRRVINTLPAPTWVRLRSSVHSRSGSDFSTGWKCFVLGDAYDERLERVTTSSDRPEYLYVSDPELPFDRVKVLSGEGSGRFVYEFNSAVPPDGFEVRVRGALAFSGRVQVIGEEFNASECGGRVRHLGRFARWKHAVRLHDVLARAYALREVLRA